MSDPGRHTHWLFAWFERLAGILDAVDAIVIGAFLLLFAVATLAGPYLLARDLLASARVLPALLAVAGPLLSTLAAGAAWSLKGFRWWYVLVLLAVSVTTTAIGRRFFEL